MPGLRDYLPKTRGKRLWGADFCSFVKDVNVRGATQADLQTL